MEVILKKSKITKSIFNQIDKLKLDEIDLIEPIGWCLVDGIKYAIFYNTETNLLSKFALKFEVKFYQVPLSQNLYDLHLTFGDKYKTTPLRVDSIEQCKWLNEFLKGIQNLAEEKGQFYL